MGWKPPSGEVPTVIMEALSNAGSPKAGLLVEWGPVLAGLALLAGPTLYYLATTYWGEDEYAHGPLIVAVIVWLVWDQRRDLWKDSGVRRPVSGFGVLALGLLLYVVGRSQEVVILEVGAFAPILLGTLLTTRGWGAARKLWLPMVFVFYLIPPPGVLIAAVTGPLQHIVSRLAVWILQALQYPIAHSGVVLTIGPYQLLVAESCSGLNSMISLTAIGLLYIHLAKGRDRMHQWLILASLLPIAFLANLARVVALVLITYHFGDGAGQGFLHGFSGILLFAVSLGGVFLWDRVLLAWRRNDSPAA
jgi:exosortase B